MKNLIVAFSVILFAACNAGINNKVKDEVSGKPEASEINYKVLKQEAYGGREAEANIVIKSQTDLNNVYDELGIGDAPKIDFSKQTVAVLFMGQKSSGGYSIGIENIKDNGQSVTISINKKSPEGMATMALSQPYCIVSISTTKPVEFR
jgi:hypothetical protein